MDFITDQIAIGHEGEAMNLGFLEKNGITGVLNVAWSLDIVYDGFSRMDPVYPIEYAKVGLMDGHGNHPATLVAAVLMLDQLCARHDRVLVHCQAGVSRSPTVVGAYLAAKEGIPFSEALARVRRARPLADPHPVLIALASELNEWWELLRTAIAGESVVDPGGSFPPRK